MNIFLYKYFVLGFLHFIVRYTCENWVWLGLELGASLTLQWICWPPLVTGGLTSSVNCSKAGQPYCDHRNPSARVAEVFHLQPSLSSSLLSSLDYRRKPILPAEYIILSFYYSVLQYLDPDSLIYYEKQQLHNNKQIQKEKNYYPKNTLL